jgi:hypothetical protein
MARPGRNASPEDILRPSRTFFVTTKTSMGRRLLQTERNAGLLIDVLGRESYENHRKYIAENPVKAGLVPSPELWPFCYRSLAKVKAANKSTLNATEIAAERQGLKPA